MKKRITKYDLKVGDQILLFPKEELKTFRSHRLDGASGICTILEVSPDLTFLKIANDSNVPVEVSADKYYFEKLPPSSPPPRVLDESGELTEVKGSGEFLTGLLFGACIGALVMVVIGLYMVSQMKL